jgi:signal transduction histidine kinase/ActR/RegA family two-component response regulator
MQGVYDYVCMSEFQRAMPIFAGNLPARLKAGDLRITSERLRLAARIGRIGFWDYDLLRGIVEWDEQMYDLYGKSPGSAPDGVKRWFSSIEERDIPYTRRIMEECLSAGRDGFDIEFRIIRDNDGEERVIHAAGHVERDDRGNALRMIGVNWDVTEEHRREAELQRALAHEKELVRKIKAAEQAKGEFLAVMSHEVRTPMTGILGFAELLARDTDLPATCRDSVRTIVSSGEALLRILDDVLEFSRLEAGNTHIEEEAYSPAELLGDLVNLMERGAREAGLRIDVTIEERAPETVLGDATRVRQILLNLLGNAIKFTKEGCVKCRLRRRSGNPSLVNTFEFVISDTGHGIDSELVETIFLPFTQADSAIARRHGGLGLGLTISRRLARMMGGDVVLARNSAEGSEFVLSLPLKKPKGAVGGGSGFADNLDESFARRHPMKVLLVEDDRTNLKLLDHLLARLGYSPLCACDGREAIAAFEEHGPDCIFMDLQMPEMDGLEATRRIRALAAPNNQPFIAALTANIIPSDRQRCFEAGMNTFLNKPVKLSALAEVLVAAGSLSGVRPRQ